MSEDMPRSLGLELTVALMINFEFSSTPMIGEEKLCSGGTHNPLTSHLRDLDEPRSLHSLSCELTCQACASPYHSFTVGPTLTPNLRWSKANLVFTKSKFSEAFPTFLDAIKVNDKILVNKYGQPSFIECSGLSIPRKQASLATNGIWPVADVVLSLIFIQAQIALNNLLKGLGIKYDYVIGHSIGEVVVGYASGHYDCETAVSIAIGCAAAMTQAEGNSGIIALGAGVQKAKLMIKKVFTCARVDASLWVAGINSPKAVTIADQHKCVDLMVEIAADPTDQVFVAKLHVNCTFHTPLMGAQENVFKDFVKGVLTSTCEPIAKVMSTANSQWLECDLGV
ncbi:hypothetical protein BDM02DRAFT_3157531 [Thelephora ganbajun]|uniref:Uncharacterized protein n=1 Tax=Thelephora ganbajun TaxID=370292 RepID=A0ACB6Z008_THEGA|nr:hypothetical protein BDM02DRAFT_3157531 [Thelephora ganbajun]